MPRMIENMTDALRQDGQPDTHMLDYLTGASGAMTLYLRLYDDMRDDEILRMLCLLADEIMTAVSRFQTHRSSDSEDIFPSGAAHGLEGLAVSLWRLYTRCGVQHYADQSRTLWQDAVAKRAVQAEHSASKWCRGDIGVLWAQNELESEMGSRGERFFDALDETFPDRSSIAGLLQGAQWVDDTVCHGRCGAVDTLVSLYATRQDLWYLEQAKQLLHDMMSRLKLTGTINIGHACAFTDLSYGVGSIGVVYTMLRVLDPSVPSILSLEVSR